MHILYAQASMHIRMRTCIYAQVNKAIYAQISVLYSRRWVSLIVLASGHPPSHCRAGIHASFTSEGRSFTDTKQKAKLCRKEGYFLTGQKLIYRRQAVYCEERKQGK